MIRGYPYTASHVSIHPRGSGEVQGFEIDTVKAKEVEGNLTQYTEDTVINLPGRLFLFVMFLFFLLRLLLLLRILS